MGLDEADFVRLDFPPMAPAAAADALRTDTVFVDAAAAVRTYMYAATDTDRARMSAREFGKSMCQKFPDAREFYILPEGNVPATKKYEQAQRSAAHATALARKGIYIDAPLCQKLALPPELGADFDAPGETLLDVLRRNVAADDLLGNELRASPEGEWQQLLRSGNMEVLESIVGKDARLDTPVCRRTALPGPLEPIADAMAAEQGVARDDLVLRDILRRYVLRGVDTVAGEAAQFPGAEWQKLLVHWCMPELERIAVESVLALGNGVRGYVAQMSVDGADTLVGEGERKALPFARHLNRPVMFYGNDSDIFVIAYLQVPRFPGHPPVYYYDIARSRGKATHVIDLVACVRAAEAAGGASLATRAFAALLCGNDYVRHSDAETHITMRRLAGNPKKPRAPDGLAPEELAALDEAWLRHVAELAFATVDCARGDLGALASRVWTHLPARKAEPEFSVKMRVRRASIARTYYAAGTRAEEPAEAGWRANGWRTMTEPWTLDNMEHYSEE